MREGSLDSSHISNSPYDAVTSKKFNTQYIKEIKICCYTPHADIAVLFHSDGLLLPKHMSFHYTQLHAYSDISN